MKTEHNNSPKYCFSYIRFSSEGQRDGNSLERQLEIAPRVAKQNGWNLREDLSAKDLGVSAYKGSNVETIERIIQGAKSGKIPEGSIMIIEALDRFSRLPVDDSYQLFRSVLKAGIEIYTDKSSRHLTTKDLNNPMSVMMTVVELDAAFQYGDGIANRVRKALSTQRENRINGQRLNLKGQGTAKTPQWIDRKTFGIIKEKAVIVRRIFNEYTKGIGATKIAQTLTSEKIPTLNGKGDWTQSIVYQLLHRRSVIGEYQPTISKFDSTKGANGYYVVTKAGEPIQNYYTAIIDEETFLKVQAKLDENNIEKRKTEGIQNLFAGIGYCACGEKIALSNGKQERYVTCRGSKGFKNKGCNHEGLHYSQVENSFSQLLRLDPAQLLRDEKGNGSNVQSQILKGRISETQKKIENIQKFIDDGLASKKMVEQQIALETQVEEIKQQLTLETAKVVTAKGGSDRLAKIVSGLENLSTDYDFRNTVQTWIRENINRITFDRVAKTFTVDLKTGNMLTMGLDGSVKECKSFVSLFTGQTIREVAVEPVKRYR